MLSSSGGAVVAVVGDVDDGVAPALAGPDDVVVLAVGADGCPSAARAGATARRPTAPVTRAASVRWRMERTLLLGEVPGGGSPTAVDPPIHLFKNIANHSNHTSDHRSKAV
jgi:hypothetical protein